MAYDEIEPRLEITLLAENKKETDYLVGCGATACTDSSLSYFLSDRNVRADAIRMIRYALSQSIIELKNINLLTSNAQEIEKMIAPIRERFSMRCDLTRYFNAMQDAFRIAQTGAIQGKALREVAVAQTLHFYAQRGSEQNYRKSSTLRDEFGELVGASGYFSLSLVKNSKVACGTFKGKTLEETANVIAHEISEEKIYRMEYWPHCPTE